MSSEPDTAVICGLCPVILVRDKTRLLYDHLCRSRAVGAIDNDEVDARGNIESDHLRFGSGCYGSLGYLAGFMS